MNETASAMLRRRWEDNDAVAVVWPGGSMSGDELLRRAGGVARWLEDNGVPEGALVPALLDESPIVGRACRRRVALRTGTRSTRYQDAQ